MATEDTQVMRAAKAVESAPGWLKWLLVLGALGVPIGGGVSGIAASIQGDLPAANRRYIASVDTSRAELAGDVRRLRSEVADLEAWMSRMSGDMAYVICLLEEGADAREACVRLRQAQ